MTATDKPKRDQRHIQSIEVGFRLIKVMEKSRTKLPLKLLAERAGMPPSKAHLYLVSFLKLGLVAQDPVTLHYGPGPYAIQLGLAGLRQLDVLDVARPVMSELQQKTELSVYLSIWGNMGPTIIAKFDGELEIPLAIKVGYVLPLLTSATGRVFLSYLPPALAERALQRDHVLDDKDKLDIKEIIQTVRDNGLAYSDSRVFDGFAAISAPLFDNANALCASLTVLGLRSRVNLAPNSKLAASLRDASDLIAREMGRTPPPQD